MRTIARPPCTRPARTKPRARNLHKQVNYQLDAAGNLISDGLRTFDYDTTNRHTKTTVSKDGEASKITYLHNALGQRVFKSEPQTAQTLPNEAVLGGTFTNWLKRNFSWMVAKAQTNATLGDSYVYADGGEGSGLPSYAMLGEYGNGGASSTGRTEYLYLPTDNGQAIPVGIYRGSRFYAVHADHLNTPRLINDDSNKAVWQWPYSAFGDNKPVGILKATTNPAVAFTQDSTTSARLQATNPAIVYNPRFPGQYADSESGLFQNGFRSYCPSCGRYSQSDPMGLAAGWNRYGYVEGNPFSYVDPEGLQFLDLTTIAGTRRNTTLDDAVRAGAWTRAVTLPALTAALAPSAIGLVGSAAAPLCLAGDAALTSRTVTSWAEIDIVADLAVGRWVMQGGATQFNYARTFLWGPKYIPGVGFSWSTVPIANAATGEVAASSVLWPAGANIWRGVFGQRVLGP